MDGGPPGNTWCRRLFIFAQVSREKYNFFVLWAHLLGIRLPVWRTIGCQNRMEVVHRHAWNVRERSQYFLCCIKYPSPQPNIEIRKPNIELKVFFLYVKLSWLYATNFIQHIIFRKIVKTIFTKNCYLWKSRDFVI